MLRTEAEAKEKFCPNSFTAPGGSDLCFASRCMAWRWYDKHSERRVRMPATQEQARCPEEPERPADLPASWEWCGDLWECDGEDNCWLEPQAEADARRRGYCGLAGKVEGI